MSPSVEPFDEAKYKALMDGLECSEITLSDLEFSGRIDSEYYQKKYLKYENMVLSHNGCPMGSLCHFLIGPFGSAYDTSNYVESSEYRYVRGQDVKPFFLQEVSPRYMAREDYQRLSKYALKEDDILVSVVGTLGNACIVQKKELPAIFSCKSTAVRVDAIDSYFLLAYLNSKYGRQLLLRKERGAVQKGLNLDDLKVLDIPCLSDVFQEEIRNIAVAASVAMNKSSQLYCETHELLMRELHFNSEAISTKGTVEKHLSESFGISGRLDAEYYQPKYDDLFTLLDHLSTKQLGDIVTMSKSIEPGSEYYGSEGVPFIRVSDVSVTGIEPPTIRIPKNIVPSIETLYPKRDTILFSKDGSVGIAYKVEDDLEAVTSGALLHLHVKNTADVLPDYLTLVLNSEIVRLQAERDASGAIIQHWKPSDVAAVTIPILPHEMQIEIAQKVQESFALRRQAEALVEKAVRAVEIAIEEDESAAIAWLDCGNRSASASPMRS